MVAIGLFHVLMIVLAGGIISRHVPLETVGNVLGYVHKTIGITMPPSQQIRMIALVWIGSMLVIVDGCLLLLVFIASSSN